MKFSGRIATVASAALLLASSAGASLAENTKIRMGYIADYFGTSIAAIATEQKLWEKHGIDAELKVFTNGPIQVQALGAGSLDFAYLGAGAMWLPASGKAKIIAVNALGLSDRVIAQKGINSLADLKGKRIGIPEGTSGDMLYRLALEKAGLKRSDVETIKMDPSTVVSAFASQQIDAAGIWYPLVGTIKSKVPGTVELASNEDFYPEKSFPSAFVVSNEFSGNTEAVKKVNSVIKEALDFRAKNRELAVEITAKFLGVDPEPLMQESAMAKVLNSDDLEFLTQNGNVYKWFGGLADLYVAFGKIEKAMDPKDYYLADLYLEAK
ncbi:aliphatic sulfonate ABC transporter substrate-binding protein [Polycladidibacter hongkongensis]|uniref:aliphatic sulfonate ABC transporter substrate-binding protein n=1 Tax=Polycladidibacter hongkongensis TaxID=1647556 RepID=UPI0009E984FE|nr:aliphatic sulfonate ABC transporter substrate-binding protein [Pseudovibrio hongkongensis]